MTGPAAGSWRARGGSTRAWRKLRAFVLARDGWVCQVCGGPADTVGHRLPLALGGQLLPPADQLRAECGPCNYGHGAQLGQALRAARQREDRRGWRW